MQLGKFSTDRDSALHYLCTVDWSTGSFGDVDSPTGYVWRISNTWEDVMPQNMEFNSVLAEWLQSEDVDDRQAFRAHLVGYFILQEDSNGLVHVQQFSSEAAMNARYSGLAREYDTWAEALEND